MINTSIAMPGYRVNEYMLILNPDENTGHRISVVRDDFSKELRSPKIIGRPNLLLCSFRQYAMKEERLVQKLHQVAMGHAPFKVEIRDFGSFPTHTIFLNVLSRLPIQTLVKKIRTDAQALMKFDEEHRPYFSMEPHFNIGTRLKPWQYEKGWLMYSQKHFTGRFVANEMLLLRKEAESEQPWQVAKHLRFENLPVETKQGVLFS